MSLNIKIYLLILSVIFAIPAFCTSPTYTSEIVMPQHVIDFNKDLTFIRKTLLEDHPGVCNALDAEFLDEMEKNFKIAEQKLLTTDVIEEKAKILQELGRSFHDAHLWIRYDLSKTAISSTPREIRPFGIQEVKQGVFWVNIPTFHPSTDETKNLNEIIKSLAGFREQTIIFDLRGNGGGNSSWGVELLNALFGEEYVNQQLAESNRNVYIEWRISQGNLDHVKALIPILQDQFGENHPTTQQLKINYKEMEDAFLHGENYYSESQGIDQPTQSSNAINSFSGHIIAIIDKSCGSACLDFIDDLKAMNANITFVGETTGADSVYMELRTVSLPSEKGTLGFPIKVYRNRPRGHNVPHTPDIQYKGNLQDTAELQSFILTQSLN